jgi:hypothetical protein
MMGGDGASGLAIAIGICMILLVLGGVALFALLGRALTRKLPPTRRRLVLVLMALAGAGLGWMLVMATFYESSWAPPPRLSLATPAGFDAPFVILLEDPRAPGTVEWRDSVLPFTAATAEISVPRTGIVRVRDFGLMAGHADLGIVWPDGTQGFGAGGGPGPPGTGARSYMIIARPGAPPSDGLEFVEPAALTAYIAQRERAPH